MISSSYFLEFIEQLDEVFFIMEYPSLVYRYISPSIASRGYTQEEVYADASLIQGSFSLELKQYFFGLMDDSLGKRPVTVEYSVQTKSGETKWYQSTFLLVNELEGVQLLVGMGRDISYRKNAELESENLKQEYEDLYNHAPNGYHSLGVNGIVMRINDTELDWLGYSREEMLGRKIQEEFLTPASQQLFAKSYPKLKADGNIYDLRMELIRKDGSILYTLLNASAVRDEQGEMVFTRSILTDITALVTAEEKLKQTQVALEAVNQELKLANQKLERLNFTKDVLLKIISHDLRNPLETIKLVSSLLHEKYDELDSEALSKYLEYISVTGQNANDILGDMTHIIQLGNKEKLNLIATNLHLLTEEAASINKKRAAEKVVILQFESKHVSPPLMAQADAKWMVRALDNLIANALKFSRKGGFIKMSCHQEGYEAVLTIDDNGIGIPSDILPILFTQENVPSRPGTEGEQGTGLGLSIVSQIIEMQAGRVGVTSTEGVGSRFEIRLPVAS